MSPAVKAVKPKTTRSSRVPAVPKKAIESVSKAIPVKAVKKEEPTTRIRIKIRAYDSRIIDQATRTIVETAERHDAKVVGPVPLPTEKVKFTVNRSTFVHKNAREQFEMRVHKRLIDIFNAAPKCIDALMSLNLPAGVDIEIKM